MTEAIKILDLIVSQLQCFQFGALVQIFDLADPVVAQIKNAKLMKRL